MTDDGRSVIDIHDPQIREAAHEWAYALCECAGEIKEYAEVFWERLTRSEGVYGEYVNYMLTQNFACTYSIEGVTVVDIMVWQIDRFKAALDEGKFALKYNGPHMVLAAFYAMADVVDNPDCYVNRFRSETGSDYEGKSACVDK